MIDKIKHEPGQITRESLKLWFKHHLKYTLVDDQYSATKMDHFISLALSVRDHLVKQMVANPAILLRAQRKKGLLPFHGVSNWQIADQ